jgi:hypothetical protein
MVVFSPMFQHRAACTERRRSRVESQSLKGFTMFQHRVLQLFSINSVEMDLTGIIQKFSTPLERKQDDGVFSRVSTSSGVEMEFVIDTSIFAQHWQVRT